ncbi:hypothetical protein I7I50_00934 [Histoplasma capsulatum G186AR]|uniref:Uncharacterized protein n=1 Tax=Ajellomyces capsulatus TaxID=5037 RepID=A0A8H7YGF2_AJECA|nr:hypothetical protein I7I52_08200 [Histoplasma capsulatum]QSS72935.1 hypothetical protein I7I50_00934 [Histoplasma capsulatum G186AR]
MDEFRWPISTWAYRVCSSSGLRWGQTSMRVGMNVACCFLPLFFPLPHQLVAGCQSSFTFMSCTKHAGKSIHFSLCPVPHPIFFGNTT